MPHWHDSSGTPSWTGGVDGSGQVIGRRHTAEKGWAVTDPEPTLRVPIRYELAYGGVYRPRKGEGEDPPDAFAHAADDNESPSGSGCRS